MSTIRWSVEVDYEVQMDAAQLAALGYEGSATDTAALAEWWEFSGVADSFENPANCTDAEMTIGGVGVSS